MELTDILHRNTQARITAPQALASNTTSAFTPAAVRSQFQGNTQAHTQEFIRQLRAESSVNISAPEPAMADPISGTAILAGAGVNAIGNVISSGITASATRYAADQQLKGTGLSADASKYSADQSLAGIKYSGDLTYKMWNRDYEIANQMGLYHPSQIASTMSGTPSGSDIYKLSGHGISRVPRTPGHSIFSL